MDFHKPKAKKGKKSAKKLTDHKRRSRIEREHAFGTKRIKTRKIGALKETLFSLAEKQERSVAENGGKYEKEE